MPPASATAPTAVGALTGDALPAHVRVAIVGSGFGGIAAGAQLLKEGEHDFAILERAHDVGGTWRDNQYPGCACDVPSHLYSLSFAPKPDWSRTFATQPEIYDYLHESAVRLGLMPHIHFGHDVQELTFDEDAQLWRVRTSGGALTADVVVVAPGPLSSPSIPSLPGAERFRGPAFHTAEWNHELDLTGKRVAVIGTGASAIQVVPSIAAQVGRLDVYQRTAPWVMPRLDRAIPAWRKRLFRMLPATQKLARAWQYWSREAVAFGLMHPRLMGLLERVGRLGLAHQVHDPEVRAKLTPTFRMGCKRILLSNDYLRTFNRANVELVTDGIREVRESSIVTADGAEREVDVIIWGTGFHVTDFPVGERIRGRGGRSLADEWQGSMAAYKGTTVAGFPNLFLVLGPNTGLGHNSIVFMIESQVRYVMSALRALEREGLATLDVRHDAQDAYNDEIQQRMRGSVWTTGGCASWYLDASGRNTTLWPGFTWPFRRQTEHFDRAAYEGRPPMSPAAPGQVVALAEREPVGT